jgi:hypothetical protein
MAEIQKGLAVAWSITTTSGAMGISQIVSIGVGALLRPTSQALTHDGEQVEHIDPATGNAIGITVYNRTSTLEMTVYPSADSLAEAKSVAALLPKKGDNMTIADTGDGQLNGVWHVESATKNKEAGSAVTFNVSLKRWEDISSYTAET